jgi:hypothetical protein
MPASGGHLNPISGPDDSMEGHQKGTIMKRKAASTRLDDAHKMLAEIMATQQQRRANDKQAAQPKVGIIFLVGHDLYIDGTSLSDGESYGHFKIHSKDHCSWQQLQKTHAVPSGEYDDYPRARVSYDTRTRQFTLFADRCIMKKDYVARIMKWMNLPKANTKIETDLHYRCNRVCMRRRNGQLVEL